MAGKSDVKAEGGAGLTRKVSINNNDISGRKNLPQKPVLIRENTHLPVDERRPEVGPPIAPPCVTRVNPYFIWQGMATRLKIQKKLVERGVHSGTE